jgi:hypothetical protein
MGAQDREVRRRDEISAFGYRLGYLIVTDVRNDGRPAGSGHGNDRQQQYCERE